MQHELFAYALIARSWVPRCLFHIFRVIYLNDLDIARSFLENLTTNPTLGQYVWRLVINYVHPCESWEEILNDLAPILSDLYHLEYRSLVASMYESCMCFPSSRVLDRSNSALIDAWDSSSPGLHKPSILI